MHCISRSVQHRTDSRLEDSSDARTTSTSVWNTWRGADCAGRVDQAAQNVPAAEAVPGDSTFTYQLRAFVKAVRGGAAFPTDGAKGIVDMRVIEDVYRAAGLPPRVT